MAEYKQNSHSQHKWEDDGFKTPLSRVKGLGASRTATGSWIALRLTAIANIPLTIWFVWFCLNSIGLSYNEFREFLGHGVNATLMIMMVISVFWHAVLGSREIIEDYIHLEWFKILKLTGIYLFFTGSALAVIFCIASIALSL